MSTRQLALSGAMAGALFAFALLTAGVVRAQTVSNSAVLSDNFDTYNSTGWQTESVATYPLPVGTPIGCFVGNCVVTTGGATLGTRFEMYSAGQPTANGSESVYVKTDTADSTDNNFFFDLYYGPTPTAASLTNTSLEVDVGYENSCWYDSGWHLLSIEWSQGTTNLQYRWAIDCYNSGDWSSWTDSGIPNFTPSSLAMFNNGNTASAHFWLDQLFTAGIDWSLISPAVPFTLGTTTSAIAASSSLWLDLSTSTITSCNSGNLIGDSLCAAGAFLFLPSPSVLEQYANLPESESTHWPFSWLYEVESTIDNATSTTGNMPAYSMDLFSAASTTFASTTMPNFLPSFTFFSSSTVMTYLPADDWSALQSLLAAVLWLGLVVDIFFVLRNRFRQV